ncbi:DUF5977 domain-containing protein [Flavobacterium tructae]|uniref:DUF5977 domain-containing protein n=1 Tax=Flavobacterium tructae TaxID=1114873 RepID=UPI002551EB04|nr:DUF5977 domain-containing protein [Flavobacterium tructae]MDL2142545.1 DUF5977 domain-containing protein [Flavobacterium tructae]
MKSKFLILCLLNCVWLVSQNAKDNFFPVTPEANSLIKYVDVPVNYSTGVTNYSIPVHTIKLKNLTIPITLSYQSSGLKPSEIAGNTGLGWELNAGGKITQNVVGQNDIDVPGPANPVWNLPNNRDFKLPLPSHSSVPGSGPYSPIQLDSIQGAGTDYTLFHDIDEYNVETQPDIFYYSIPNKSGKFFFGSNFEAKQIPFGKEKILFNTSTNNFEIIDTDGVRYIYNTRAENLNFVNNMCFAFPALSGSSRSNSYTYYLVQIVTPNNETVDFIYDTVKYNLENDKDYTRYYHWIFGAGEKITSYYSEITTKVLTKIKVNQDYEINFLYNKYRKDIKGKAQATAPKTLDKITVNYKNETETYQFDYGYFGTAENQYNPDLFESIISNENTTYRLKLRSFQKTGENPYIFSYHNELALDRNSPCLDHWGYFSGNCSRYTMNTLFNDVGGSKAPSLAYTQTNILKNIVLPTKGEVDFIYELNTCSDSGISYTTYNWEPVLKAYANSEKVPTGEWITVEDTITISEKMTGIPYVQFDLISPGEATTSNYAIVELRELSGGQERLMNFEAIGKEGINFKPYAGEPLQRGKTYKLSLKCYDTMENSNKFIMISYLMGTTVEEPIASVGGLRIKSIQTKESGNLATSRSFDYNLDDKSSGVLYELPYYYGTYSYFAEITNPEDNNINKGMQDFAVQYSRIPSDIFGFNGYHIFYKKVTEKNTDSRDITKNIKTEKYFTFYDDLRYGEDSHFAKISYNWKRGLPLLINEFNKNDIARKTTFSYHFSETPPGNKSSVNDPGFPLVNATAPNEFYKRSIALSVYRRNPNFYNLYQYTNSRLISAWYYMDKKTTEENLDGKTLITEEEYKYDNPLHAQLTSQVVKNSLGERLETKYYYPDDLSNEPFMAELKTANRIGMPITIEKYRGGTLFSKNKTVYAKDASTGNLLLPKSMYEAKFPNTFPSLTNIGNLEKKITYNQYDEKGNVLQYTIESGISVAIVWGYNKTLPIAKIENVAYNTIPTETIANLQSLSNDDNDNCMSGNCTEQLLRNALNAFRNTVQNAFITTYTYNPLAGVTSVTDPKGVASYYEYDVAGRLKFVKDKDLNVLQKYCYNYKGQQVNCSDNSSSSVFLYKSAARSGSFTKDNCPAGGTAKSVTYSQAAGAYTSDISQADADDIGLRMFNAEGKAYANNNSSVKCVFKNTAKSAWFTRNNCAPGGVPESILYTVPAGKHSSENSQADADNEAQKDLNDNGYAYANANARCTFWNTVQSGSFTKNNCAAGGVPETVVYTVPAGRYDSYSSQAAADKRAQDEVNANGLANANAKGRCTFWNTVQSGSFTKNNCAAGGVPETVVYTVPARTHNSYSSQAAADKLAQDEVNANGLANANANGRCRFWNTAQSGSFTRNNCAAGGVPQTVVYTVPAGRYDSYSSQAAADKLAQDDVNANGLANANAKGTCTFYSAPKQRAFSKDNCPGQGVPQIVTYYVTAGKHFSTSSQAAADALAQEEADNLGQAYANAEGSCTFNSVALSGSFTKDNCPPGGYPSSVSFSINAGTFISMESQEIADRDALKYFREEGLANANEKGTCTFYSAAKSGTFTRNNCTVGGIGSTVTYTLAAGSYNSTSSQAAADELAQTALESLGRSYANSEGTCTYYSPMVNEKVYKNDCPGGTTNPYVYYYIPAGKYWSYESQNDAFGKAMAEFSANSQAYANEIGVCLGSGEVEE